MTVKELKKKLEHAVDENAEVRISTAHGKFTIVETLGHYKNMPFIITCVDVWDSEDE